MKAALSTISNLVISLLLAAPAIAGPNLLFDQPVYDFGKVAQGKSIEHVFTFRNTGDAPANIGKVDSSCGCTVANVSSRMLQPGARGEIKATFNSSDFGGPVTKEVYVHSNDPRRGIITLTMKGIVIEDMVVTPGQVDLGAVKKGVRKDAMIKIENSGTKTLKILSVKTASPVAALSWNKTRLKPGESCMVRLSVTPQGNQRFISGYLTIKTNSAARPEKTVPFYAVLQK
ncbi:MAG: DUF1573 domain-containing protein [Geobacteraceae bacterium]|nr:DUF1573 domain-containing protein [Geobacteraceae bacterium]